MRGEVEAEAPLPRELKLYYLFVYNRRLRHRFATAFLKATLGWAHGLLLAMRPISSGGGGAKRGARVFLLICFSDNRGAKNSKAEERCWSTWRQGRLLARLPVTVQYKGSNIPLGLI